MESIGERILRLRNAKGWSRPKLGREMARAIGRKKPFSGELIRLYEENTNRPRGEARRALALSLDREEIYIEFGVLSSAPHTAESAAAGYDAGIKKRASERPGIAEMLLVVVRTFLDTDDEGRTQLVKAATTIHQAHAADHAADRRGTRTKRR